MLARQLKAIISTTVIALTVVAIFSASLQTAEVSSAQSGFVKEKVNDICMTLFNAEYDELFPDIRKVAHFAEFALLGVECAAFCLLNKKKYYGAFIFGIAVAVCDEMLQLTSDGRAASVQDVLLDFCGFTTGMLVVIGIAALISNFNDRRYKHGK